VQPKTIADQATIRNLFLPLPDTDFREYLAEVDDLARFAPEIITAITADLDLHARQKNSLRLADRKFFESRTRDIPCLAIEERAIQIADLSLADGRPRMPAENNVLTINAAATVTGSDGCTLARQEYGVGNYHRDFALSDAVRVDGITAKVKHGVLEVVIPKREEVKTRKIKIE